MKFNKEYKTNVKIKEKKEWYSNADGDEETKRRTTKKIQSKPKNNNKQTNKQTNKRRKPVHPIKEMNEKLK